MNEIENKKTKIKKKFKLSRPHIIIIVGVLLLLFTFVGFTKAGYIENYLGFEILCSSEKNPSSPPFPLNGSSDMLLKPVIYLYPEKPLEVQVMLDYQGEIIADYPDYDYEIKGWNVIAYPGGKIIDPKNDREYSYLFWEGMSKTEPKYDMSSGFVVKGNDTKEFLQNKLSEMGLTAKEYNEFIVFWYPRMKNNKYNLIHFAGKEYTDIAKLEINPQPDSVLRVFMVYKKLDEYINIKLQDLELFKRKGFTVIEWGGTELE